MSGDVRLSELVNRWIRFNERLATIKQRRLAQVALVKFMYAHRDGNMQLHDWLSLFLAQGLQSLLDAEPRLQDDKEKVLKLLEATGLHGPLQAVTVAFFGGFGGSPDHLTLTTLHSAKGLEYDVVVIVGLEDGRIPYYSDSSDLVREKRRLFYVGLTRARHEVHLMYSGWYTNSYGRRWNNGRSRFVDEVAQIIEGPESDTKKDCNFR